MLMTIPIKESIVVEDINRNHNLIVLHCSKLKFGDEHCQATFSV